MQSFFINLPSKCVIFHDPVRSRPDNSDECTLGRHDGRLSFERRI